MQRNTVGLLVAVAAVLSVLLGRVHGAALDALTVVSGIAAGLAARGALPASKKPCNELVDSWLTSSVQAGPPPSAFWSQERRRLGP